MNAQPLLLNQEIKTKGPHNVRALSLVDSILNQRHTSVNAVLWLFFAALDQRKVISAVFAAIS